MSETEKSQETPAAESTTPEETLQEATVAENTPRPEKRTGGVIAIVIALLVAALTLYLWFDLNKVRQQTQAIEEQVQTNVARLEKSESEQRTALSAEALQRDEKLAARQEGLEQEMQAIREQLDRQHVEWVVAESDYLLRYASRRLLLERDVRSALMALHSADNLLAESANPLYLPVREALHAEIQSLEILPAVDVDGIALELSTVSKQVDTLPLSTARRDIAKYQAKVEQPAEEGSTLGRLFSAMWQELKGLVTVRRLNQKVQPLLPPEERYFLAQNLRLRLETARLALLRGDGPIYQENLRTAVAWLDDYYDSDDAAVKRSRDVIARLAQVDIAPPLPELGTSLSALEHIEEKQMGKPAGAKRGAQP